ncbi:MAG TPA: hypothetical protein VH722_18000, partial [Alphaproteobacteria bacterium]|nr:hypothetical protein [Alphaproteobacteria bacterium]
MPDTSFEPMRPAAPEEIARILEQGQALVSAGDFRQAINYVTDANREIRSPELERELMVWRAHAFPTMSLDASPSWPPRYADPHPGLVGLAEIDASQLTVEMIGGTFQHHGPLLVRNLIPQEDSTRLRNGIDRAIQARDEYVGGVPGADKSPWYAET